MVAKGEHFDNINCGIKTCSEDMLIHLNYNYVTIEEQDRFSCILSKK